ncbi:MAG: SpoIIE family protein phosphatase [Acidobacteria bacterium]|nr:SpoIIE family protein phosphatase [Acidobacteriota bacterium]
MARGSRGWQPRLNAAVGAVISLVAFALSLLGGAALLSAVFGILAAGFLTYLGWRALSAWRGRLLWRLRNRLIVTYLLIGLIPVVLLTFIGLIVAWTLYAKVAVYQVTEEFERLEGRLQGVASDVGSSLELAGAIQGTLRPDVMARILAARAATTDEPFSEMKIYVLPYSPEATSFPTWFRGQRFSGVVVSDQAELVVTRPAVVAGQALTVLVTLPMDETVLAYLGREVGPISLQILTDSQQAGPPNQRMPQSLLPGYRVLGVAADRRPLPPPEGWWDTTLTLAGTIPTAMKETGKQGSPLVLIVQSRLSLVHSQLSYRLGEFSGVPFAVFIAAAVLFLLLEIVALRAGILLTRTVTGAVNDLQMATERVQAGDFSQRIRVRGHDQLSGLATAFNSMTASIERLIQESKDKQRLENELEVARQVQEQLFPGEVPTLATIELVARCRPARTVGGDYFDYGLTGSGQVIFTIGDISGKGISGALLMATIQSALRSQVYASRLEGSLARLSMTELVSRVNRQLCATTSDEKYSSLFVGHYDDATRALTYVNAGHLPPVVFGNGRREELTEGGPVVGVFREAKYDQGTVQLRPGDWLVAFTDGLTEVENAYEEEYGSQRLVAFLQRTADSGTPDRLIDAVLAELEQWAPGIEASDDRTMLVARIR